MREGMRQRRAVVSYWFAAGRVMPNVRALNASFSSCATIAYVICVRSADSRAGITTIGDTCHVHRAAEQHPANNACDACREVANRAAHDAREAVERGSPMSCSASSQGSGSRASVNAAKTTALSGRSEGRRMVGMSGSAEGEVESGSSSTKGLLFKSPPNGKWGSSCHFLGS